MISDDESSPLLGDRPAIHAIGPTHKSFVPLGGEQLKEGDRFWRNEDAFEIELSILVVIIWSPHVSCIRCSAWQSVLVKKRQPSQRGGGGGDGANADRLLNFCG